MAPGWSSREQSGSALASARHLTVSLFEWYLPTALTTFRYTILATHGSIVSSEPLQAACAAIILLLALPVLALVLHRSQRLLIAVSFTLSAAASLLAAVGRRPVRRARIGLVGDAAARASRPAVHPAPRPPGRIFPRRHRAALPVRLDLFPRVRARLSRPPARHAACGLLRPVSRRHAHGGPGQRRPLLPRGLGGHGGGLVFSRRVRGRAGRKPPRGIPLPRGRPRRRRRDPAVVRHHGRPRDRVCRPSPGTPSTRCASPPCRPPGRPPPSCWRSSALRPRPA